MALFYERVAFSLRTYWRGWPDLRLLPGRPLGSASRVLTASGRCPDVIHHAVRCGKTALVQGHLLPGGGWLVLLDLADSDCWWVAATVKLS
jgi:hypothetical protein